MKYKIFPIFEFSIYSLVLTFDIISSASPKDFAVFGKRLIFAP